MEAGIVGLPFVGKTTLFNALTSLGAPDASKGSGAMKANVGVAHLPDPRLDILASIIPPQKITRASLKVVDAPGLAIGAGAENAGKTLAAVREVDALCHVVRCFESGGEAPSPERDIDAFETELALADLGVVEGAIGKAERSAKSGEKKTVARYHVLQQVKPVLEEGLPVRSMLAKRLLASAEEREALKELSFLTAKPSFFVANVGDDDLAGTSAAASVVRARAAANHTEFLPVCAKIEAELSEMAEADRLEMLAGLGLKEPALPALAHSLYKLLGLQSFYTAGPKEVRAWTIHAGDSAVKAAGTIHSDIERGFIRAEIYSVDDLAKFKSEKAIKEGGRMRAEGKSYIMQDGDVCHFLFNV